MLALDVLKLFLLQGEKLQCLVKFLAGTEIGSVGRGVDVERDKVEESEKSSEKRQICSLSIFIF
jgi:hypothetical protein